MTPSEHLLLIDMFAQQTRVLAALTQTLKAQGIIQSGDLEAYDFLLKQSAAFHQRLELSVAQDYLEHATRIGLTTGLVLEDFLRDS